MEVALRSAVEESLAAYAHSNAVFMAERLVACHPNPESSHLLATAYHAAGETHRAYSVLNPATTPRNRSTSPQVTGPPIFLCLLTLLTSHALPTRQIPAGRLRVQARKAAGRRERTDGRRIRGSAGRRR